METNFPTKTDTLLHYIPMLAEVLPNLLPLLITNLQEKLDMEYYNSIDRQRNVCIWFYFTTIYKIIYPYPIVKESNSSIVCREEGFQSILRHFIKQMEV